MVFQHPIYSRISRRIGISIDRVLIHRQISVVRRLFSLSPFPLPLSLRALLFYLILHRRFALELEFPVTNGWIEIELKRSTYIKIDHLIVEIVVKFAYLLLSLSLSPPPPLFPYLAIVGELWPGWKGCEFRQENEDEGKKKYLYS